MPGYDAARKLAVAVARGEITPEEASGEFPGITPRGFRELADGTAEFPAETASD